MSKFRIYKIDLPKVFIFAQRKRISVRTSIFWWKPESLSPKKRFSLLNEQISGPFISLSAVSEKNIGNASSNREKKMLDHELSQEMNSQPLVCTPPPCIVTRS